MDIQENYQSLKRLLLSALLIITAYFVHAQDQPDTVYQLQTVNIVADKMKMAAIGLEHTSLDSISLAGGAFNNLGELLQKEIPFFIKSYGSGSLATISLRGTAPEHTGVYWNGFKLNQPNIQMTDLALLPVSFFNKVDILYGGASSTYGDGNIGGSIHLANEPEFSKIRNITMAAGMGSFHRYQWHGKVEMADKKEWSSTNIDWHYGKNDFFYTDLNGDRKNREQAAIKQFGIMHDMAFKLIASVLKVSLWAQRNNREIPATLTTSSSEAEQTDESVRMTVTWKKYLDKNIFDASAAVFFDQFIYMDPLTETYSDMMTWQIPGEINYHLLLNDRARLVWGLDWNWQKGISVNYTDQMTRDQIAAYFSARYQLPLINWALSANVRNESVDNEWMPVIFSAGMEGSLWKKLSGRLAFGRNYRLPSFNDLYWEPFGNKNLLPEDAFNQEIGFDWNGWNDDEQGLKISGTLFRTKINNRILWVPDGNVWQPVNIAIVLSRGLNTGLSWSKHIRKAMIMSKLNYAFVKSTNEAASSSILKGKQLIYTPRHQAAGMLCLRMHHWLLEWQHQYVSARYVISDNSAELSPYHLDNIRIRKEIAFSAKKISVQLSVDNIFNVAYETIQYYPVPGISWHFQIVWEI